MHFFRRYSVKAVDTALQSKFKDSMSRVSSQAMVLTAGFKNTKSIDRVQSLHGMTLSSVCSLSVYPTPLLQFNLHLPSYTSQTLHENEGVIALHLLLSSPLASKLGRVFASGIKHNRVIRSEGEEKDGEVFHEMATPFKNIEADHWKFITFGEYKIPILNESERIFICNKKTVLEIDNHELWVVNVVDIIENKQEKTGGLLYYNRAFHKIGDVIEES